MFVLNKKPEKEIVSVEPVPETQPSEKTDNKKEDSIDNVDVPVVKQPEFDPKKYQTSHQALVNILIDSYKERAESNFDSLAKGNVISPVAMKTLREAMEKRQLLFDTDNPAVEVGSWDAGNKVRYRLNFKDGMSGVVDMVKDKDGLWTVNAINLPDPDGLPNKRDVAMKDAIGISERFLMAVRNADFESARSLVDSKGVANATLAGLCILFEEAEYSLRKRNPLKEMFMSGDNAGYLVYLNSRKGGIANLGLTLKRQNNGWLIGEISMDSLLESYVKEVAEGEETYVPLVKNPKGGDALVLFFGFNQDTLTARSIKQLKIVADIVKLSNGKKLEISGHTDDVGGEKYNQSLSERRAKAVKEALVAFGVPAEQIVTEGFGKKMPRRTYGSEDPEIKRDEARRVNRRAEMYLDF